MDTKTWKIKPGETVQGICPTCRRSLGAQPVVLGNIDLATQTCRCGRPFNGKARKRVHQWMCGRKTAYTSEEAEAVVEDMRANGKGLQHVYPCPFDSHFHVGAERKDLHG